ncbi:MAG: anti-sigma factor antagonist [Selenomonadaceae bacterium]|nr:anti-sigma factor antagonist [Selenomonadaceae bacterium]
MNDNEILKKVNPLYFSAKGCLGLLAETGDLDIVNFYNSIDKEQLTAFDDNPIIKGRIISLEVRYHIWNVIAKETDCQTIVDLPCGYLPHSLITARLNKNYYGLDLPIVTDEISRVADKFLNEREKFFVQYHSVDATNYFSMHNALKDVQGKICIITDGLLGHFNCDDLKIFCGNIHRLLMKFGGCWYTTDSHFTALMSKTYAAITGKDEAIMSNATSKGRKKVGEFDKNETVFTNGTFEERRNFLEECGFTVESFRYPEKLKIIPSLKDNPTLMNKILAAYQDMEIWKLTADDTDLSENEIDLPFTQNLSVKDNILSIRISGRLDTITAPKLLQQYEEYQAENKFAEIHIDAAELSYISYAGLRVFKIMRESLDDENLFKIVNANDEVGEILKEDGYTIN